MLRAILLCRGISLRDTEPHEQLLIMKALRHELTLPIRLASATIQAVVGAMSRDQKSLDIAAETLRKAYMQEVVEDTGDAKAIFEELHKMKWTIASPGVPHGIGHPHRKHP